MVLTRGFYHNNKILFYITLHDKDSSSKMNLYLPQLPNSPDGIIIVPSSSPTVNPKSTPFCEIMAVWFSAFIILVPENDIVIGSDIPDWPDIINNATGVLAYVVPLKDIVFIPVSEEKTIDFIYTLSLKLLFCCLNF